MERNQQPSSAHHPEDVHLSEYFRVLHRNRWTVLIVFAAVLLGVALFSFTISPVYEATATLQVRGDGNFGSYLDGLGLKRENPVGAEIELLKSRTNMEEVVRRLHLDRQVRNKAKDLHFELREFTPRAEEASFLITLTSPGTFEIRDRQDRRLIGQGSQGKLFQNENLSLLLDRVEGKKNDSFLLSHNSPRIVADSLRDRIEAAEVGRGTRIVEVSFQDTDPEFAREVVNTLAQVYLERSETGKTEEASRTVDFIEAQLAGVHSLLDGAEHDLEIFKRESGIVKLDSESESLIDHVARLEQQRAETDLRWRQVEFAIETLEKAITNGETYAPAVLVDDPVVSVLGRKLAELEIEAQGLQVEFTSSYPGVRVQREQAAGVQRRLLATYRSLQAGLRDRAAALNQDLAKLETEMGKRPEAERRLAYLTRIARVNADVYTFLLQKHEEARITKASAISNINIIDPAITPKKPIKPNRPKNLAFALVVGLASSIGLAFFREYLDNTVKDADSAKRIFGRPVLAVIPHLPHKKESEEGGRDKEEAIRFCRHPLSQPAEAFRSLRTALHFCATDREKKVLLVTSGFAGEGKTTITANLGVILSQAGARVLIIDCDLRRPSGSHPFGKPLASAGLAELLTAEARLEEVLHFTGIERLDYLAAGNLSYNPAELLGSGEMRNLLREQRQNYDHILLDAPPLLAVTDGALLAGFSDHVLVVLEAGRIPDKAARHFCEVMERLPAPVLGLTLNDKTGKGAGHYGSCGQGGYGYYGYGYQ